MKKKSMLRVLLLAALTLGLGVSGAKAQILLGVQLGLSTPYAGTGVLGESFTTQLTAFPTTTSGGLGQTTGAISIGQGLTLTISATNMSSAQNGNTNASLSLYKGSFYGLNSPLQFTIGGLSDNTAYELAVYSDGTINHTFQGGTGTDFAGAVSGGPLASLTDPSISLGTNALENLSTVSSATGTLTFTANPTTGTSFVTVNGFGIASEAASVPEPPSMLLLIGGVAMMGFFARWKNLLANS